jgi:hypothetical protein
MAATTSISGINIIGLIAPPAQETTAGGKQTMSALVEACIFFGKFTEIISEDDWLDDDISGIFEELEPF